MLAPVAVPSVVGNFDGGMLLPVRAVKPGGPETPDAPDGPRDFIMVTGEIGIGAGLMVDGRPFPATLTPALQGYSIGHWEGNTLTVETRGISTKSDMFIEGGIKVTNKTKVTERMIVESGTENAADGRMTASSVSYR